jgi:hypothetical protein
MAGLGPDLNAPEQIAFSDDTGEPPLVIDHGKTTDAPFEHQLRGFDYTRLGLYGHDIRRHDVDGFHLFLLCGDRVVHRRCSRQPQAWPRMSRRVSLLLDADQLGDAVAGKALPGAELGNGYFTKVSGTWASLTTLVATEPRNRLPRPPRPRVPMTI